MTDEVEEKGEKLVVYFGEACAQAITRIQRLKKSQQKHAAFWGFWMLLFAFKDFYQLHYVAGIFDCLMAESLAMFHWWCFTSRIKDARDIKHHAATLKLEVQQHLATYRHLRGF